MQQSFLADSPNSIWVGDITYIPTDEDWLYEAIVKDLFTRQVVGYACSSFIDTALVSSALLMAVRRHKPSPGLFFIVSMAANIVLILIVSCFLLTRSFLACHVRAIPMIMLLRKAFSVVSNVKWFIYIILKHILLQNL